MPAPLAMAMVVVGIEGVAGWGAVRAGRDGSDAEGRDAEDGQGR